MAKLNLEELAETAEEIIPESNGVEQATDNKASNDNEQSTEETNAKAKIIEETAEQMKSATAQGALGAEETEYDKLMKDTKQLLGLPFVVAMQNLKLDEDEVIEAGKAVFTKGFYEKKIELPFDTYMILTTKRAMDELDYFSFLYSAMEKDVTVDQFRFMSTVRQLADILVQHNDIDFRNKTIDERYEYLMSLSSPLLTAMANRSQKFWALLLLMMHKDLVGFLMRKTHQ